jgi:hypothetical protein
MAGLWVYGVRGLWGGYRVMGLWSYGGSGDSGGSGDEIPLGRKMVFSKLNRPFCPVGLAMDRPRGRFSQAE